MPLIFYYSTTYETIVLPFMTVPTKIFVIKMETGHEKVIFRPVFMIEILV